MIESFVTLDFQEQDGIGTLSFNRPKQLNALSAEVIEELNTFCEWARSSSLKGLILTGSGDKAFIAGADIKGMSGMSSDKAEAFSRRGQEATLALESLPFPVIAAVNGFALGGGLEMALACDFILASSNAVFGLPEVSLGLIPGFGGTQRLAKIIGRNRAKELVFTGQKLNAQEAMELGLALRVYPDKEALLSACSDTINKTARNSLNAIAVAKYVINKGADLEIEAGLGVEASKFGEIFDSYDMKEGTSAFMEKRKPDFLGK